MGVLHGRSKSKSMAAGEWLSVDSLSGCKFAQKELRPIAVATGGDALVIEPDGYTKVIVKCKGKDE
jgi:hypothetical protein